MRKSSVAQLIGIAALTAYAMAPMGLAHDQFPPAFRSRRRSKGRRTSPGRQMHVGNVAGTKLVKLAARHLIGVSRIR